MLAALLASVVYSNGTAWTAYAARSVTGGTTP